MACSRSCRCLILETLHVVSSILARRLAARLRHVQGHLCKSLLGYAFGCDSLCRSTVGRRENERLERALAQLAAVNNRSRGSMAEDLAVLASVLQAP